MNFLKELFDRFLPTKAHNAQTTPLSSRNTPQSALAAGARNKVFGAVFDAVMDGDMDRLRALIAAGADVNEHVDSLGGETALMFAAGRYVFPIWVNVLIAAGADVNATDNRGSTALVGAASSGNADSVKALIAAGAVVNAGALKAAYSQRQAHVVKLLKAAGAKE